MGRQDSVDAAAVQRVESTRGSILATYEDALRRSGSPLLNSEESRQQCLDQASNLVTDICESLRLREVRFATATLPLSRNIGAHRAASGVHPKESLAAALLLYDVVLTMVTRAIGESVTDPREAAELILTAASALYRGLMVRLWEGSAAYAGLLLNRVHEAHLDERRRIVRELHDRVGSGISAASRNLELYQIYSGRDPVRAGEKVAVAERIMREAVESVRQFVADLRPSGHPEGLEKSLRAYVDSIEPLDCDVQLTLNGDERWATEEVLDELFLVVREALRNAIRHAQATTIVARIDVAPHFVYVVIQDDGVGFVTSQQPAKGMGLSSMRDRVALLGGTLTISSQLRRGTSVEATVPLAGDD